MRKCFVIRPFSNTNFFIDEKEVKINQSEWEHIYNVWIKPSVENYPDEKIQCNCSELLAGNFLRGILSDIYDSDFVIADLTGQKPNVYYELGIRHALRIGTIIITQDINALPSDLRSYSCIEYKYPLYRSTNQSKIDLFAHALHKNFTSILKNNFPSDSPVSDFLKLNHFFIQQIEMNEMRNFYAFIDRLEIVIKSYFDVFRRIEKQKTDCLNKNKFPNEIINISRINNLFSSFINLPFMDITNQKLRDAEEKLFAISDTFNAVYHRWDIYGKTINKTNTGNYFDMIDKALQQESKYAQLFLKMKQELRDHFFKKFKIEL
jgi:hypothetical protein